MANIMLGAVLGLLFGGVIFLVGGLISLCADVSYRTDKLLLIIGVILIVVCFVGGAIIGGNIGVHTNASFIQEYEVVKNTIESSITNDDLSGFERVELVNQATEINSELVKKQYDAQQWYGFLIPDEVLELEPITFGVDQ